MNTKALVGLVIIIAIALIVFAFVGKKTTLAPTTSPETSQTSTEKAQSLRALVEAGQPVLCTFSSTTPDGTQNGTLYIYHGMVAGDFILHNSATTIDAHMITKDTISYVWTSMSSVGYKSSVGAATSRSYKGVAYDSPMDYRCKAWSPDVRKFDLPKGITFSSSASSVAPTPNVSAGAGGNADATIKGSPEQCSACAQLQSQQKAQCLTALHC